MIAWPLKVFGISVILIAVAQDRIVERVRPLRLRRGGGGIERCRAQAGAELPAHGQQPLHRGAKRFLSILRTRRMGEGACDGDQDADDKRRRPRGRTAHVTYRV